MAASALFPSGLGKELPKTAAANRFVDKVAIVTGGASGMFFYS